LLVIFAFTSSILFFYSVCLLLSLFR